jgi:hypothetical protein
MKLAIMQPYFLPYIGYWQLINAVDMFVVYDNIKYTKKGWINRNYYLINGQKAMFTLNLTKDSDGLDVNQRFLSDEYKRSRLASRIKSAYRNAPMAKDVLPVIEEIINYPDDNLFGYIFNSVSMICKCLGIKTKLVVSSTVDIDHSLKSEQRVIAICKGLHADAYINPVGGKGLYKEEHFAREGIELKFIKPEPVSYQQYNNEFVPGLSIMDVMMFNSLDGINILLDRISLVENDGEY